MTSDRKKTVSRRSLRRKVLAQLDRAIAEAEQTRTVEDETIHTIRQRCKRIRACLRLLRETSPRRSRRAAEHVRDAGAALSPLRDAQILPAAMKCVAAHAGGQSIAPIPLELAEAINSHTADLIATVELPTALAIVTDRLHLARESASEIKGCHRTPMTADVLALMYQRCRKSAKKARRFGKAEAFHQLRKDVKAHREHCRLLSPMYKKGLAARIKRTRKLALLLGDAQDLAVLREFLSNSCRDPCDPSKYERYRRGCDELIGGLHLKALVLASQLYASTAKQFVAELESSRG